MRITGEATFVPPPRGADHGLTAICGSVAQARFAGFPQWRALVSPTDYQSLAKAANSVGIFESAAIEEFGERAAARAHQFLDRHWPQVRMLAAKLLEAGGQLNAQQIESALSTRVAFNLQQGPPRKMAHEVHVRRRSKAILDYDPY
ncbi:MAG TPA: hypothetical protein VHC22_24480 [Pirellulales bacterium]|nr:hypothetical protein [Pirellulales bacterium]